MPGARVKMSRAAFDAIAANADAGAPTDEAIVAEYCERLLYDDEAVCALLFDPEQRGFATTGQRILYALSTLDSQVKSGGLTQFFWNCPDLIDEVTSALTFLELTDLAWNYEDAVRRLQANREAWDAMRAEADRNPDLTHLRPFPECYQLVELTDFDDAYYDKTDPDNIEKIIRRGLYVEMLNRLREYVATHAEEYVEA